MCPARCSHSSSPRQIASQGVPFGCRHCHASHSAKDNARRLRPGVRARSARMVSRSVRVIPRPRYLSVGSTAPERTNVRRRTQVPSPLSGPHASPHRRRITRRRIAAHDQPLELMRLKRGRHRGTRRPPPKAPAREPLLREPESLRVVDQNLDRRAPATPEHEQRATERIGLEDLAADARPSIPFRKSWASIATRMRICGVICIMRRHPRAPD